MALTVTTNYNGIRAAEYIAQAIFAGKMTDGDNELMTIYQSVKNKINVPTVKTTAGIVVPYATDFADSGAVTVSDKELDPQTFSVMIEIDLPTLMLMAESEAMSAGYHNSDLEPDLEGIITRQAALQVSNVMDNIIWNSDTAGGTGTLNQIDGLLKQLGADADVNDVTAGTITKANVIAEFEKVDLAETAASYAETQRVWYMNSKTMRLYKQTQAGRDKFAQNEPVPGSVFIDDNRTLVSIPNFPDNTIVSASPNNLIFATDLTSDQQAYRITDMRQTTNDDKIRIRMDFKADVKYGFGDEIVLYA